MSFEQIRVETEVTSTSATKTAKDKQPVIRGYRAPEMHVVGKASDLVQGNFGYSGRDGQYYYS